MSEVAARVVSIEGLTKSFRTGVTALADIDLEVAPREFVSLIGPSGCGKSTLLRIIGDLVTPTSGTVRVNGKSAHQARVDRNTASEIECVTNTTVDCMRRQISSSSMLRRSRVISSSAPNGSSMSSSAGEKESARAIETRCCMPPESCQG